MRIGIFETNHFEGAYPLIKLFDNGVNEITIFTYESSFRQFEHLFKERLHQYHWVVKTASESKLQFIYRLYKVSKQAKFDVLYLNTISDNHIVYAVMIALLKKSRVILTLHDINNHFSIGTGTGMRGWIRFIGKKALVKMVKEFNVVSSTMVDYLKSRLPPYKKVYNIPGSVFEEMKRKNISSEISNPVKIVIPGTVDKRRRNYDLALETLGEINQRNLQVSLILLGGINEYGTEILEKCKEYVSTTGNLKFFQTDIVDQPIFDREMDEADFIFIPSLIDTVISDGIRETYGLSISSGTIFDVIKHAKPFIAPVQLAIPENLESSCFKFKTKEDVIRFLESLLNNPVEYAQWKTNALKNSRNYTIESIRKSNPWLFA